MNILITGCAGFIGFNLTNNLLQKKNKKKINIFGIDNLNSYYDIKLKNKRLNLLKKNNNFVFYKLDISNSKKLFELVKIKKINIIIHLAAQAGVRHSINHPEEYFKNNMTGFFNILESSRKNKIHHLIFASTSSVYGDSKKFPLNEDFDTNHPLSFYAATKKSNEVMAYSYSNIYKLKCTGLRFFTVYGEYGRPDMSLYKFTKSIISNQHINLFNKGNHIRDFTYIDDVVNMIGRVINKPSKKNVPYQIFNVCSQQPNKLIYFLNLIEKNIGKKAKILKKPLQKGDVYKTHGSIKKISKIINYKPRTSIEDGIKNFVSWFRKYNKKL